MKTRLKGVVTRIALVSILAGHLVAFLSAPAIAAIGDVLRTVNLPASVACVSGINQLRTSLAVVQGSKLGFPDKPIVLVTSCFVEPTDITTNGTRLRTSLFVLDPGVPVEGTFSTATLLTTITTSVAPTNGWGSLAYRADKGDLLGCASFSGPGGAHQIYAITFNGTATKLFDAAAGLDVCDGAAWDPSDDSVFMSPDVSTTIYHYKQVGTVWQPPIIFASPPLSPSGTCPNSGLALVGGTLFAGCDGVNQLFQLDKTTGQVIRSFVPAATLRTENIACDPVTFASQDKDALWSTDGLQGSTTLFAFEIPGGTCGLPTGPTVLYPAACLMTDPVTKRFILDVNGKPIPDPTNTVDTDGDGLLDCWEDGSIWAANPPCPGCLPDGLPGIDFDGDGIRDITLCITNVNGVRECADKNVKDLFVEVDTMAQHPVNVTALNQVIAAFVNAPVNNPSTPSGLPGPKGIRLHVQVDDQNIPHNNNIALTPCTPPANLTVSILHPTPDADFDTLKPAWFGTAAERGLAEPQRSKTLFAKKMAFRYMLMAHDLTRPTGTTSASGCSEIGGNDAVVTLGSFPSGTSTTHKNGTTDQWGGTFMHELGHMLGLRHGGGDNVNCKPNYLSVMSYTRQFANVITDRPLDYSGVLLPSIDKTTLNETAGIGGALVPAGAKTTWGPTTPIGGTSSTATVATATSAINWNNLADSTAGDTSVAVDINRIASGTGCDGTGGTVLTGYNDWANIQYNLRASLDFGDGVHSTADEAVEINPDQAQALFQASDVDGDGIQDANACGSVPCMIDIVPGLPKNPVLLFNVNGVPTAIVPVAVLSTLSFDATTVNPATVTLNGTRVAVLSGKPLCVALDVSSDHRRDLVCTFVLTGLAPGDEVGVLEGRTFTGRGIRAQDTMHVVRFGVTE
jgi:hypothetical protein